MLRQILIASTALGLAACGAPKETGFTPANYAAGPVLELAEALSSDALQGRQVGTEGNAQARALITARFAALGVRPYGAGYEAEFKYGGFVDSESGEPARPDKTGLNILGYIPGTSESSLTMVVSAHYDHLGVLEGEIYNGMDDNASGVAGLTAVAEYFAENPPLHTVAFAAFDAEEEGLSGARAFVANPPVPMDQIAFNLNMDMISRGDNGLLWASGAAHWPALTPLVEEIASRAPVTVKMGFDTGEGREDWTLLSDHGPFFRAGIPHLYFGVEDHPDYHQPGDDFEKIDQDWFLKSVDTVVMMSIAANKNLAEIAQMKETSSE